MQNATMDEPTVEPMRPATPIYQPQERFEISAAGLEAFHRSNVFNRLRDYYEGYPLRSLFNTNGRALLHHLIVMQRPERVLEIGTMYAGTTECLARAVWEAGRGHVETIDPFGAERCPPLIAGFPPELRERVTFSAVNSATQFSEDIERGRTYDFVLIDGLHELEYVAFELACLTRLMRPGGLIVLDNIEQIGPRFATKDFLEKNPDWIDVADVVRRMDPGAPLDEPVPSFPETKNYVLQAPATYTVGAVPRSPGTVRADGGRIDSVELDLARPASGTVHVQAFVRTWGPGTPTGGEELTHRQQFTIKAGGGERLRLAFDSPLQSRVPDHIDLDRRIELILAFVGDGDLVLASPPATSPAKPR
jgi:predicted O-methyltransferase YrrM